MICCPVCGSELEEPVELPKLTPQQYSILLILLENAGKFVKADHILYELYTSRGLEEPNNARNILSQQLYKMRMCIGDFVEGRKGLGYRLKPSAAKQYVHVKEAIHVPRYGS